MNREEFNRWTAESIMGWTIEEPYLTDGWKVKDQPVNSWMWNPYCDANQLRLVEVSLSYIGVDHVYSDKVHNLLVDKHKKAISDFQYITVEHSLRVEAIIQIQDRVNAELHAMTYE